MLQVHPSGAHSAVRYLDNPICGVPIPCRGHLPGTAPPRIWRDACKSLASTMLPSARRAGTGSKSPKGARIILAQAGLPCHRSPRCAEPAIRHPAGDVRERARALPRSRVSCAPTLCGMPHGSDRARLLRLGLRRARRGDAPPASALAAPRDRGARGSGSRRPPPAPAAGAGRSLTGPGAGSVASHRPGRTALPWRR